jgi:hypothetical protein
VANDELRWKATFPFRSKGSFCGGGFGKVIRDRYDFDFNRFIYFGYTIYR